MRVFIQDKWENVEVMKELDRLYKTSVGLLLIKWNSRIKSLSLGSGMLFSK